MADHRRKICFPSYTKRRHETLLFNFYNDISADTNEHFYGSLMGSDVEDLWLRIEDEVRRKFEHPVTAFIDHVKNLWDRDSETMSDGDIVDLAVKKLTARVPNQKKIHACRALVTCGLLAGPSCFPEVYQERIHRIGRARGKVEENLPDLVPGDISLTELRATQNMQLLMTEMEDDLSRYWRELKPDKLQDCDWCPHDRASVNIQHTRFVFGMKKYLRQLENKPANG